MGTEEKERVGMAEGKKRREKKEEGKKNESEMKLQQRTEKGKAD